MNRSDWARPLATQDAYKRAGGRRGYNAHRALMADLRRARLAALLIVYAWPRRGGQAQIAAHLGVSEATISRDLRRMTRAQHAECQATRDLLSAVE